MMLKFIGLFPCQQKASNLYDDITDTVTNISVLDRCKYILFELGLLFPFHHFLICCATPSETWTWNLVVKNKQLSWHNNIDFQPSRKKMKFSLNIINI